MSPHPDFEPFITARGVPLRYSATVMLEATIDLVGYLRANIAEYRTFVADDRFGTFEDWEKPVAFVSERLRDAAEPMVGDGRYVSESIRSGEVDDSDFVFGWSPEDYDRLLELLPELEQAPASEPDPRRPNPYDVPLPIEETP